MTTNQSRTTVRGHAPGPLAGTSAPDAPGRAGPPVALDSQFEVEVAGTARAGGGTRRAKAPGGTTVDASASDLSCRDGEHCGGLPSRPTRLDLIADWIGLWDCLPHRHRMRIWKRLGMSLSTQRGDTP